MATTDARPIPQKNAAYRITTTILDADGDPVSAATIDSGLGSGAGKAALSKDGGALVNSTNNVTETPAASGLYVLDLTAAEMNFDTVAILVKTTTVGAKATPIILYPEEAGDIRSNVTAWSGTAVAAPVVAGKPLVSVDYGTTAGQINLASGDLLGNVKLDMAQLTPASPTADTVGEALRFAHQSLPAQVAPGASGGLPTVDASNAVKVQSGSAANQIDLVGGAVKLQGVAHTGATIPTVTTVSNAVTVGTNNDKSGYGLSTAAIDAIWDEAQGDHLTTGSFGAAFSPIRQGTAQAGAAGTITLDASASASDDFYNDAIIQIISGTGAGQVRVISDYVGATKVASVTPNWVTAPNNLSVFVIHGQGAIGPNEVGKAVWDRSEASIITASSIGLKLKNVVPLRITKNTALTGFEFIMFDSTNHVTGKIGLTPSAQRSIDGAAFVAMANTPVEVSNGVYKIDLAAADTNGNFITYRFSSAGADDTFVQFMTQPAAA